MICATFSPLHLGQATAMCHRAGGRSRCVAFQSPPFGASHCNCEVHQREPLRRVLSVPSIRGKPLQSCDVCDILTIIDPFSPLHSGQATAIFDKRLSTVESRFFQSPPFGASHCNLLIGMLAVVIGMSFSPLHSGQATEIQTVSPRRITRRPFSPLHSGQATAMKMHALALSAIDPFSPLHSGQATAIPQIPQIGYPILLFQSPPFGASHCNEETRQKLSEANKLSVPSIEGSK